MAVGATRQQHAQEATSCDATRSPFPNVDFTIRAAASAVADRAARAENLHEPADIAFDLLRKHLFEQRARHDAEEAAGLRLEGPVDLGAVADAREAIMPAVVQKPTQGLIR